MKWTSLALGLLALACSDDGDAQDRHALASARAETRTEASLAVSSPAFAAGAAIPLRHSAYGDGVSPGLRWSGVPAGTRSLALMMEDPDASSARPYVHWLAWNIDPALGALPEGLPAGGELQAPVALRQGRNTRRVVGYFGRGRPARGRSIITSSCSRSTRGWTCPPAPIARPCSRR